MYINKCKLLYLAFNIPDKCVRKTYNFALKILSCIKWVWWSLRLEHKTGVTVYKQEGS